MNADRPRDPSAGVVACLAGQLRAALPAGAAIGFLLGIREGLLTLRDNAFGQPDQYAVLYVAVPILACTVLGALVVLPSALTLALVRRPPSPGGRALHVAIVAFAGGLSVLLPWVEDARTTMHDLGATAGRPFVWGVGALVVALAGSTAALVAALARSHERAFARVVAALAVLATVVGVATVGALARFRAGDWKDGAPASSAPGVGDATQVRDAAPVDGAPQVGDRAHGAGSPHDGGAAGAASRRPNVLLISIDTLRADHLGAYGSTAGLTPNLDRVAAEGAVFSETVTPAPWTLPAMASLLTGLEPRHHGAGRMVNGRDPLGGRSALAPGVRTLAAALRDLGHRTNAIVTNPYLTMRYGFGAGFDGFRNLTVESEVFLVGHDNTGQRLLRWLWPQAVTGDRGTTVSARAVAWLRSAADAPFFLWLHYVDPHAPYAPGSAHKSFRGDSSLALRSAAGVEASVPAMARLRSGEVRLDEAEKEELRALYRGEVRLVDAAVGTVLDELATLGLADDTLVVVVSDHGEEFWEHGGVEHGRSVYEEVVRVPWILRLPGRMPAGRRIAGVARLTDVAPTVLALLGAPPLPVADGVALDAALHAGATGLDEARIENLLFAEERVGLRTANVKYVRWDSGIEELYDLAADARERRNLVADEPALALARRELAASDAARRERPTALVDAPAPDAGTRAALRALGYLQ